MSCVKYIFYKTIIFMHFDNMNSLFEIDELSFTGVDPTNLDDLNIGA